MPISYCQLFLNCINLEREPSLPQYLQVDNLFISLKELKFNHNFLTDKSLSEMIIFAIIFLKIKIELDPLLADGGKNIANWLIREIL